MANMQIITGSTGTAHVQAENDRAFNNAIAGADGIMYSDGYTWKKDGNDIKIYSAQYGALGYKQPDNNTIVIYEGDLLIQGCQACIPYGQSITFDIEPGASGYDRVDAIVAHYHKDELGIESVNLELIKGTPYAHTDSVVTTPPEIPQNDIYKGATDAYMYVYLIRLIESKVKVIRQAQNIPSLLAVRQCVVELQDVLDGTNRLLQLLGNSADQTKTALDNSGQDWVPTPEAPTKLTLDNVFSAVQTLAQNTNSAINQIASILSTNLLESAGDLRGSQRTSYRL